MGTLWAAGNVFLCLWHNQFCLQGVSSYKQFWGCRYNTQCPKTSTPLQPSPESMSICPRWSVSAISKWVLAFKHISEQKSDNFWLKISFWQLKHITCKTISPWGPTGKWESCCKSRNFDSHRSWGGMTTYTSWYICPTSVTYKLCDCFQDTQLTTITQLCWKMGIVLQVTQFWQSQKLRRHDNIHFLIYLPN